MRARLWARGGAGRHAAGPDRPSPRLRLRAVGRYAAHIARSRRRVLSRIGVAALLLPVAVGAGGPAAPAPAQARSDTILTRALSVTTADDAQPVASVTVLPERWQHRLRPEPVAGRGVPAAALRAYVAAEATMRVADPSCRLRWSLLAGIGEVESRHGRAGSDRLGPMQFVPVTWQVVGVDADGDDRRDQRDIDDAALGAAAYLCAGPGDLGTRRGALEAVVAYNRSPGYADVVLALSDAYRRHVDDLPAAATAALPTGGVTVGVGSPGEGVLVGGSDNVVPETTRKRRTTAEKGASRPAPGNDAPKRKRADRHNDPEPAPERGRPRPTRDRGDAPPSPAPRPGPTPTRKPAAEPSPKPTTKPSPRPAPRPAPRPSRKPAPAPVITTYSGTVESSGSGFLLNTGTLTLALIGEWGFEALLGRTVTVSGVLKPDNTLEVTSAPVTLP